MNISMPALLSFGNSSQDDPIYDVDSSTKTSYLLIGPLIKLLQTYVYSFVSQSEDHVLNALRSHEFGNTSFVKQFLTKTVLHLSIGYIFIAVGLVTLLLLPLIYCKKLCSAKSINLYKYQPCFCIEGFLCMIATVILFVGSVSCLQTALQVDDALQTQPTLVRGIIHDLHLFEENLKSQLTSMKTDHDNVLDFILQSVTDIPTNIGDIVRKSTESILSKSKLYFQQMYTRFEEAVHNQDIIMDDGELVFLHALDSTEKDLRDVRMALDQLKLKIMMDQQLTLKERETLTMNIIVAQNKANIYIDRSNMTNWTITYGQINETLQHLMPQANESLHFLEKLQEAFKQTLDKDILDNLNQDIARIKAWTNASLTDFNSVSENIASESSMNRLTNLTTQLDKVFTFFDITSSKNIIISGRMILMLIPGVHSICLVLILIVGGIIGMHEVKQQNQIGSKTSLVTSSSLGARVLRFGTLFSCSILWFNLLVTGCMYIAASLVTMTCLPVMDFSIFTKYIDDREVWGGRTWIDSQIEYFTDNFTDGVKMADVLQICSNRHTLFTALNNNQRWNLEEKFNVNKLLLDGEWVTSLIYDAVENSRLPDAHIGHAIIMNLDHMRKGLDFNFTLQIQAEITRFRSLKINENHLEEIFESLSRHPKYDYIQDSLHDIMLNITRIETKTMSQILRPYDRLDSLKDAIDKSKVEASSISDGLLIVDYMMKTSILPKIAAHVNLKATVMNNYARSFTQQAIAEIQSKIGNCYVLYNLFVKAKWCVCEHGLTLLNAVWISHGVMSLVTVILIILGCRISGYFQGAQENAERWSLRLLAKEKERTEGLESHTALVVNGMGDLYGRVKVLRSKKSQSSVQVLRPKKSGSRTPLPRPGELLDDYPSF